MNRQPVPVRELWRRALVLDLSLFNIGIFFLAYLPPQTLTWVEGVCMAGSAFCIVGLLSHLCHNVKVPGDEWAYLATAWIGAMTLIAYVFLARAPITYSVSIPVFLAGGIASAGAAHIIDGGKPKHAAPDNV
jgi:hypothetical protein